MLKSDAAGKCINAFEVLSKTEILRDAYETIKSKSGNMVPGSDKETLDGISETWFSQMSVNLVNESFKPKPSRRVYIPKANGKMRPLGISSPRDKIVQQAMRIVMEMVLEPTFQSTSHGFRPKRGCHSALKNVRSWKGVSWFLEGDIKSFFDSINHQMLARLLEKHFQDQRLINLYWKLVKAGYIEWDKKAHVFVSTDKGVPQGGIVSPLLSNLVLHELDLFIKDIISKKLKENDGVRVELANPVYNKITREIKSTNPEDRRMLRKLYALRRKHPRHIPNPEVTRLEYVRYADDWLVGVWGRKVDAVNLRDKIKVFLEDMQLDLSIEKTLITNARSDRAKFLGTYIKKMVSNKGGTPVTRSGSKISKLPGGNLWMTAPTHELIERLKAKKFLKIVKNKWEPLALPELLPLPVKDMILRYRTIIKGFLNFYSFADNRRDLKKLYWILKESLRKTISRKFKIGVTEFMKRFGPNIAIRIRKRNGDVVELDFPSPIIYVNPYLFYGAEVFTDPLAVKDWGISTISALGQPCANCGTEDGIEMHHVKHLKTLNVKLNAFDKHMARVNRKQVPLCSNCHDRVHNGTYHGMALNFFQYIKWEGEAKWC
jgi:group II intron reverse transcriptase/maturase